MRLDAQLRGLFVGRCFDFGCQSFGEDADELFVSFVISQVIWYREIMTFPRGESICSVRVQEITHVIKVEQRYGTTFLPRGSLDRKTYTTLTSNSNRKKEERKKQRRRGKRGGKHSQGKHTYIVDCVKGNTECSREMAERAGSKTIRL
ncbi:hypothetical protein K0M31_018948, partial [Melipona bicolor]